MKIKSLNVDKRKTPYLILLLSIGIWLIMAIYGAFHDPNVTIQEGLLWDEKILFDNSCLRYFLLSGNYSAHQHLYHLIVYSIYDVLDCTRPISLIYIGRTLSLIFGLFSITAVIILIKFHIKKIPPQLIASIILLHPLFFFYCFQAEAYAMLFFMGTLQLILYFDFEKNRAFPWLFGIISVLGFFTHYYFVIILIAECVNEFISYLKTKKIKYSPFFIILVIFIVFLFQVSAIINSPAGSFVDGYLTYSWTLILKMLGIFWGITPLILNGPIIYLLSIIVLIITFYFIFKNINSIPRIISIYFILLLLFLIFQNAIFSLKNFSYPTVRHYIHIVLPFTIIIGIALDRYKKNIGLIVSLVLILFVYTDYKIITNPYKYDALSVINYIKDREQSSPKDNYITLISPSYAALCMYHETIAFKDFYPYHPGKIFLYAPLNIRLYQRPQMADYRNINFSPLFLSENSYRLTALKKIFYLDTGYRIYKLKKFLEKKNTKKLLTNTLLNKDYNFTFYELLFLNNKHIQVYKKNRLLLEILYPQYVQNMIRTFLYIDKVIDIIIDAHVKTSHFYILNLNESIFGIKHIDSSIQKKAISSMLNDNRLILEEKKSFQNVEVYAFARKH